MFGLSNLEILKMMICEKFIKYVVPILVAYILHVLIITCIGLGIFEMFYVLIIIIAYTIMVTMPPIINFLRKDVLELIN